MNRRSVHASMAVPDNEMRGETVQFIAESIVNVTLRNAAVLNFYLFSLIICFGYLLIIKRF